MEETPQNPHLKTYIVIGTMVIIAVIILATIWGIMGGSLGTGISKEDQAAQEQKALEDAKAAAQKALLEQQAKESQQIIEDRNIKPPTQKELKGQAEASKKIIQQRGIKPPTQAELDQQAAESAALLKAMQQ